MAGAASRYRRASSSSRNLWGQDKDVAGHLLLAQKSLRLEMATEGSACQSPTATLGWLHYWPASAARLAQQRLACAGCQSRCASQSAPRQTRPQSTRAGASSRWSPPPAARAVHGRVGSSLSVDVWGHLLQAQCTTAPACICTIALAQTCIHSPPGWPCATLPSWWCQSRRRGPWAALQHRQA